MPNRNTDIDVAVVGLGVMGALALWRLSLRGIRVLGIEQFEPGHARGASHGESRVIRTAQAEGLHYVPLAQMAWRLWAELETALNKPLIERTGALLIGTDDALISSAVASAEAFGLEYRLMSGRELRRHHPQHLSEDDLVVFHERQAGYLRADVAMMAAVREACRNGAHILSGVSVRQVIADDFSSTLVLEEGTLTARSVVVANGAWLTRILPELPFSLSVSRRVVCWFGTSDPALFAPSRFPVFIRTALAGAKNWYGFPSLDGSTIKIGIHSWPGAEELVDLDTGNRAPDDLDAELLGLVARESLTGIDLRAMTMKECMYATVSDKHFVVGRLPTSPGVIVAAGLSGHGFKFAPALGEIVASLATEPSIANPIPELDPARLYDPALTKSARCDRAPGAEPALGDHK